MALETALAKASTRRVDLRDPAATDHPLTLAELDARLLLPERFPALEVSELLR